MKVLIIICVVVLLLQLGVVGIGIGTSDNPKPTKSQIEDGDWKPQNKVPKASGIDEFLDPIRPRIKLPWKQTTIPTGGPVAVAYTRGHKDRRLAKFELTGGTGIKIRYDCDIDRGGYYCPQITCLCLPGEPINTDEFLDCDEFPLNPLDPSTCPTDANTGVIFVYGKTGTLLFTSLGDFGGKVRLR